MINDNMASVAFNARRDGTRYLSDMWLVALLNINLMNQGDEKWKECCLISKKINNQSDFLKNNCLYVCILNKKLC